jgi:hypothetical protein
MSFKHIFFVFVIIVICLNILSLLNDKNINSNIIFISENEVAKISVIRVDKVFSNSFFFTSTETLGKIDSTHIYRLDNLKTKELIYFKVNTFKTNDSLHFFQHIDWLTKKNRKINTGQYVLNKIDHVN